MEKKVEYKTEQKEKTLLDEIINFMDSQGNEIHLSSSATRRQYASKHTDLQWEQVKDTIEACGLDPRKKEVYSWIVNEYDQDHKKIGEKVLIVTNYLVYIARALASGKLKSMPIIDLDDSDTNMMNWKIKITIERRDIDGKFIFPGWFKESSLKRGMWLENGRPRLMFMKAHASLALRWALADVMGGMPYTQEEIDAGLDHESESQGIFIPAGNEPEINVKLENEKENNEKAKNDFLENLMAQLSEIKTIAELEKKYKTSKKFYDSSEMKNSILSLFASRKRQLQIEAIQNVTNCGFGLTDIDNWLSQVGDVGTIIDEALAGNADALSILKTTIASYVDSVTKEEFAKIKMTQEQNEALSTKLEEMTQEEMDLQEMRETGVE